MAAIRALPTLRPRSWLRSCHSDELGLKYYCWPYLSTDDGSLDTDLDICLLCGRLCCQLGCDLSMLPGDRRFGTRRGGRVAEGGMGSERELENMAGEEDEESKRPFMKILT